MTEKLDEFGIKKAFTGNLFSLIEANCPAGRACELEYVRLEPEGVAEDGTLTLTPEVGCLGACALTQTSADRLFDLAFEMTNLEQDLR